MRFTVTPNKDHNQERVTPMSVLMILFYVHWVKEVMMLIAALDWYCQEVHGARLEYVWLMLTKRKYAAIEKCLRMGRAVIDEMRAQTRGIDRFEMYIQTLIGIES